MKTTKLAKRKIIVISFVVSIILTLLIGRVWYIQFVTGDFLKSKAYEQQTRDRLIKATRGSILDRNGVSLGSVETVASISIIKAQIEDKEQVAKILSEKLGLSYDYVLEKTEKNVALERIKTKVDKDLADEIRQENIKGIVIDEDIKRVYPYSNLASQVIGFVGGDNQGIIGLEAIYDKYLKGEQGKILSETDAAGNKMVDGNDYRQEPINGYDLVTTIDVVLQEYTEQTLNNALEVTGGKRGAIILMDPNTGGIMAMANKPDFDLNNPFQPVDEEMAMIWESLSSDEQSNELNKIWRNFSINDTYEPGSTFKIFTSVAGLEEKVVELESQFQCSGSYVVAGRTIRCWRPQGHGDENFIDGVKNSCNPVFMQVAERMGSDVFYDYIKNMGLIDKTGIDLPGEAAGIMHKKDNIGPLELATVSFGQSFQITPIQLLRGASIIINGGYSVNPHIGMKIIDSEKNIIENLETGKGEQIISQQTSEEMKIILEQVVYDGTGNKTYLPGYRVGGKTATSEKLPRGNGKYIASFLAFAPADDPKVVALVLIDEPVGAYYGGQIAGPIMQDVLKNTLPYLGVEPDYNDEELFLEEVQTVTVPNFVGITTKEAKALAKELGLTLDFSWEDNDTIVKTQFPLKGEVVNDGSKIILGK